MPFDSVSCCFLCFFNNLAGLFVFKFRSDVELHYCMDYGLFGCE